MLEITEEGSLFTLNSIVFTKIILSGLLKSFRVFVFFLWKKHLFYSTNICFVERVPIIPVGMHMIEVFYFEFFLGGVCFLI